MTELQLRGLSYSFAPFGTKQTGTATSAVTRSVSESAVIEGSALMDAGK